MLGFLPLSSAAISESQISTLVSASAAINGLATVSASGGVSYSANGAILGRAIVTAYEGAIQGTAAITGRAVVTALGGYSVNAVAAVVGTANVSAMGTRVQDGAAQIVCVGQVSAFGQKVILANASIVGIANVQTIAGIRRPSANASIRGSAIVNAKGMIYGEEWTKQPIGDNTWQRQE